VIAPWSATPRLGRGEFEELRRRTIFECGKWDPQFEDVCVLADFALLVSPATWRELARLAERLAAEALAAERELSERPELHGALGLPRAVRRALRADGELGGSRGAVRVLRFDFHLTTDGWRISEVNSDVPGGFLEASSFGALAASLFGHELGGDPTSAIADAALREVAPGSTLALVHATAYTDDRQVMVHLARALEARGLETCLISPADLRWRDGRANVETSWFRGPADMILRFFPGEWLPSTPSECGWPFFFRGSRTPISNPGASLLIQSKRFPLVWDDLSTELPTWRSLLPETRSPREVGWRADPDWVLKPAFGRVGEDVGLRGSVDAREWRRIARAARWWPSDWAAQRRFEAVPLECDGERCFPCIGMYVVDGRAAGAYGRVARRPLIDARAQDIAVLVSP